MVSDSPMRRSQVILRLPVDHVTASLILHDGDRSDVVLFVSPDEDIGRVLSAREPFLPMMRAGKMALVARAAIATLGLPTVPTVPKEDDLPVETQLSTVRLRSGQLIEGELRWTGAPGAQRTADYLNSDEPYIKVFTADTTYYVVKHHVALVEER
jgi:hypothetical protein